VLDAILGVTGTSMEGGRPIFGGFAARIFLLLPMIKGLGAIRSLNQAPAAADAFAGMQP
jgi:hypothetical protein